MADFLTAVDLGSNSFCTRTIDLDSPDWTDTLFTKRTVGLANFIDRSGFISQEGIARARSAAAAIKQQAPEGCRFTAVGTESLRSAVNSSEFISFAESIFECPVRIISGIEEAELMFLGACAAIPDKTSRKLVLDIGGASVEFAAGLNEPEVCASIRLGCLQMYNDFFSSCAPTLNQWTRAVDSVAPILESELQSIKPHIYSDLEVYGISGTFLGIYKLAEEALGSRGCVRTEDLDKIASDDVIRRLIPEKANVLFGGTALLKAVCMVLGIDSIKPAYGDLALGVLSRAAGIINHHCHV